MQPFTDVLWKRLFKTSLDNIFVGYSFFNEADGWRPEFLNEDSYTNLFLRISVNF